jgi:hypothetical protein
MASCIHNNAGAAPSPATPHHSILHGYAKLPLPTPCRLDAPPHTCRLLLLIGAQVERQSRLLASWLLLWLLLRGCCPHPKPAGCTRLAKCPRHTPTKASTTSKPSHARLLLLLLLRRLLLLLGCRPKPSKPCRCACCLWQLLLLLSGAKPEACSRRGLRRTELHGCGRWSRCCWRRSSKHKPTRWGCRGLGSGCCIEHETTCCWRRSSRRSGRGGGWGPSKAEPADCWCSSPKPGKRRGTSSRRGCRRCCSAGVEAKGGRPACCTASCCTKHAWCCWCAGCRSGRPDAKHRRCCGGR